MIRLWLASSPRRGLAVMAALFVAGAIVFFVLRAGADGEVAGRMISRYDVTVDVEADGSALVTIDMDFEFGAEPGHGPYIWLPLRQGFDSRSDRVYRVTDIRASSATGAPAGRYISRNASRVEVRVGDTERGDISGTHQYTISYRLDGMLNPRAGDGTFDEFYWNAVGDGWEIPILDASVTVRGPDGVAEAACFVGRRGATDPCASADTVSGTEVRFSEPSLPVGRQLTVAVGWPAGTFEGASIQLVPADRPFAGVDPRTPGGILALVVLVLGSLGTVVVARWRGRDRVFAGVTPGLTPGPGSPTLSRPRDPRTPVAVRFDPPQGLRPGVAGTLVDGSADPRDVTATIIDLAVRGYLRIEEVETASRWNTDGEPEWRISRLKTPDETTAPFEDQIMAGLFATGQSKVRLASLRLTFAGVMDSVQEKLYEEVVERGWFRASPRKIRTTWIGIGTLVVFLAVLALMIVAAVSSAPGAFLPCFALAALGVVIGLSGRLAVGRTPEGSAVLDQLLGFRRFIETAEANQLRWEEGEDVFSRYLPFAVVFGETERWEKIFAELAAQGRLAGDPSWYSATTSVAATTGLVSALSGFTAAATSSVTSSTTGSSGGSGFSGGGSAGGGGGGGGGGGW